MEVIGQDRPSDLATASTSPDMPNDVNKDLTDMQLHGTYLDTSLLHVLLRGDENVLASASSPNHEKVPFRVQSPVSVLQQTCPKRVSTMNQYRPGPQLIHEYLRLSGPPTRGPDTPVSIRRSLGGDIESLLLQLDTGRILTNYTIHIAPHMPMLHLPTIDFGAWIQYEGPRRSGHYCCLHHDTIPRRRPVHRSLVLGVLTLGAIFENQHALAERLFKETGSAIREYLKDIRMNLSSRPPPVDLIQALAEYISYGLCSGNKAIEESMLGHLSCLGGLVQSAELSKPRVRSQPSRNASLNHGYAKEGGDSDWLAWTEEEERKRTYFAILVVMSSTVNYLNIQPFLNPKGIDLTLPADEDLWEAKTAACWRQLSQTTPDPPHFREELGNLFLNQEDSAQAEDICNNKSPDDATEPDKVPFLDFSATESQNSARTLPSQFGCLVLIAALNVMVWERSHRRFFAFGLTCGGPIEDIRLLTNRRSIFRALQQWQKMWISYPKHYRHEDTRYRLLACCIPLLDHAELVLHVNITQAKEALFTRDYQKTSAAYSALPIHVKETLDSQQPFEEDSPHSSKGPYEEVENDQDRCSGLRGAAQYAVDALELAVHIGPWWSSDAASVDAPIQCIVGMFYCTQVISSWLLALSARMHQSMNLLAAIDEDEQEDLLLLQAIKKLIQHRKKSSPAPEDASNALISFGQLEKPEILEVAVSLIEEHVHLLERVLFWPRKLTPFLTVFKSWILIILAATAHLIEALRARTGAFHEMSKLIRARQGDEFRNRILSIFESGENLIGSDYEVPIGCWISG
ncbi:hypothetical protein K432DRAFT_428480 [Lepidopterella palustris CBS 459.81]|uniref:Xylanolytic transcriptional activator regulatory domain-containing protein n=1 Tax=Lepidopterella palustris CBS 459.81 TaxID=1314670 RepID=A0A8E2JCA3_9PEZI|nr:hypothetical protein K432DRAFT_428480 [Lepidopterella palustris CBS 459.81]